MDRTSRCELLAGLPDADLARLAEQVVDSAAPPLYITPPTVGMVMVRVADGARNEIFNVGEVLVTECHVRIGEAEGWAMVQGSRPTGALHAAAIDAVLTGGHPSSVAVDAQLTAMTAARLAQEVAERRELDATRVRFETQ